MVKFVNFRDRFKDYIRGIFYIQEIYTFLSSVVPTYFVGETAKKSFENVQKRLNNAGKKL